MKICQGIMCALAVALLGGCAMNHARAGQEQARLAAIHAAAGQPVGAFNFTLGTLYSWQPLNERELLIYTRPRQAWLVNVGLCPELPYTASIGITSHMGQVGTLRDSVLVNRGQFPCRIQKIQPVDVAQLKHTMNARKGAKVVAEKAADSAKP